MKNTKVLRSKSFWGAKIAQAFFPQGAVRGLAKPTKQMRAMKNEELGRGAP